MASKKLSEAYLLLGERGQLITLALSATPSSPRRLLAREGMSLNKSGVLGMFNHREAAYALLRITVGVMFLFYGVGKFLGGVGNFAGGMAGHFAGKLPAALVLPFAYVLPFAEVTLGALILLGLFNAFALSLSGLLLVALTFGTVMLGDAPTVAHNVQFALVTFVLLYLADHNGYSVDRLRRPKPPVSGP